MRTQAKLAVLIGLAGLGSGCMSDAYRRADGLTNGAGNTMAGNSVMQMVDPWQDGVQDTKLWCRPRAARPRQAPPTLPPTPSNRRQCSSN